MHLPTASHPARQPPQPTWQPAAASAACRVCWLAPKQALRSCLRRCSSLLRELWHQPGQCQAWSGSNGPPPCRHRLACQQRCQACLCSITSLLWPSHCYFWRQIGAYTLPLQRPWPAGLHPAAHQNWRATLHCRIPLYTKTQSHSAHTPFEFWPMHRHDT